MVVIDQSMSGICDEAKLLIDLYIRPTYNLGFAKSMNEGIIHGMYWGSDYIIASNDDVEYINKDWWQGILDTFEKYPKAMVVNPASIADRNAEPRIPYKKEYTSEDYFKLLEMGKGTVIDGICMWMPVFPRSTIEKIGLFDERFFPGGGEDYDYNARVYKAGGRALGTFSSYMVHHWGQSKDVEGAVQAALPPHQENWNDLNALWGEGNFDIYNPRGERDPRVAKIPL